MFPIFDQNKDVEAILINDVAGAVSSKAIIDFISEEYKNTLLLFL